MMPCPDCGAPWNMEREPRCPCCALDVDDVEAAGEFLARVIREQMEER